MEIIIKCDQMEEAAINSAISELCPCLKDLVYNNEIEIRSLDIKFLKSGEEILIYISSDMTNMAVRKISTVGNIFKILNHIMNDSFADLVHNMGDFDVLINGEIMENDGTNNSEDSPSEADIIPTAVFSGI